MRFISRILFCFILVGCASSQQVEFSQARKRPPPVPVPVPIPGPVTPPRDMWVWQSGVASDAAQQATFFKFASSHAVRNIYIECEGLIQNNQAALSSFITLAAQKNVGVYCLFANPPWALTTGHAYAVSLAQKAATFKATNPLLLGVQYDVEPYQLSQWNTDQKGVGAQYISMIQKIKAALGPCPLTMTIPFWWDSGYDITINGVTKNIDAWVLDYADIAIMDYRNTTARITPGMDTIDHAAKAGRKAVVGLLMEQDTLTYTSFYSFFVPDPVKGEAYMDKQMNDSAAIFMANPSQAPAFAGFALEDYASYLKVSPP